MVANGERVKSAGCCKRVQLSIQGISDFIELYLLKLEGCEVVLGAHWLRTLGPILWNFSNLWMQFAMNGKECQIRGDLPKPLATLNPSKIKKTESYRDTLLQLCSRNVVLSSNTPDP